MKSLSLIKVTALPVSISNWMFARLVWLEPMNSETDSLSESWLDCGRRAWGGGGGGVGDEERNYELTVAQLNVQSAPINELLTCIHWTKKKKKRNRREEHQCNIPYTDGFCCLSACKRSFIVFLFSPGCFSVSCVPTWNLRRVHPLVS